MLFNGKEGPIPGENFTSDTKNYPWHQPPEFSNVGDALEKMALKLSSPKVARGVMAFADAGFPLTRITQMIVMEGVAQGKWTVDMGLLLAGPFCKIMEIMCDSYDINYKLGIEEDDDFQTGTIFKGMVELDKQSKQATNIYKVVKEQLPAIEEAADEVPAGAPDAGGEEQDLGTQGFTQMMSGSPEEKQ